MHLGKLVCPEDANALDPQMGRPDECRVFATMKHPQSSDGVGLKHGGERQKGGGGITVRNRHQRPFSLLAPRLHKHRSTELVSLRLGCVMAKLPSGLISTLLLPPSYFCIQISREET